MVHKHDRPICRQPEYRESAKERVLEKAHVLSMPTRRRTSNESECSRSTYDRPRSTTSLRSASVSASADLMPRETDSAFSELTRCSAGIASRTARFAHTTTHPAAIASPMVLSKLPEGVRFT